MAGVLHGVKVRPALVGLAGMALVEGAQWLQRKRAIQPLIAAQPWWFRWSLYYAGTAALFFLYQEQADQFIYFQF